MLNKCWLPFVAVCVVAPLLAATQADKPPDPKELGVVQQIRTRIEEHSKKAATAKPAPYKVTIPNTTVSYAMVPVPAGEFTMGSGGAGAKADEQPQHKVKLDAFWMH